MDRAWDEILSLLRSELENERGEAVEAVRGLPPEEASQLLERALVNESFWARASALEVIAGARWAQFVPRAEGMLEDSHPWVRSRAIEALAMLGSMDSAAAIMRAMDDADITVRISAAWALGELKSVDALLVLAEAGEGMRSDCSGVPFEQLGQMVEFYRTQLAAEAKNSIMKIRRAL